MTGTLEFSSPGWRERFGDFGWAGFDDLWQLEGEEVEPGNVRRGGWSSVVRFEAADGSAYYLKRQEDHDYRYWARGIRRAPTVAREWQAGIDFRAFGIGTAEPICLGMDRSVSSRGLLVTSALDDHASLPEVLQRLPAASEARQRLWYRLADAVRLIHEQGYRHNCLYGQHILILERSGEWECAFIDLEKATRTRRFDRATIADLSALDRHTDDMSMRDRQWFWDRYFKDVPLAERKKILLVQARRTGERTVSQYLRDCRSGRRGELAKGPA